jgi:hypothetical protein
MPRLTVPSRLYNGRVNPKSRLNMVRIALLLAAVAALASALATSSTAAPTRLTATVGPGYTITLTKGSSTVRTLKRGTYLVTVRDPRASTTSTSEAPSAGRSRASAGPARRR